MENLTSTIAREIFDDLNIRLCNSIETLLVQKGDISLQKNVDEFNLEDSADTVKKIYLFEGIAYVSGEDSDGQYFEVEIFNLSDLLDLVHILELLEKKVLKTSEDLNDKFCPACGRKHPLINNYKKLYDGSLICDECSVTWGAGEKLK